MRSPIITQNSERRTVKKKRLEKIMIAAMKQSLKFHLPILNDPTPLNVSYISSPTAALYRHSLS